MSFFCILAMISYARSYIKIRFEWWDERRVMVGTLERITIWWACNQQVSSIERQEQEKITVIKIGSCQSYWFLFLFFVAWGKHQVTNIEYMRKRAIDSSCCCLSVILWYLVAPDGLYEYVSFKQDDFSSRHSTYSIEVYRQDKSKWE